MMGAGLKIKLSKRELLKYAVAVFFVLTPLLSAVLFCLKDGRWINDVYIPLGGWSDEITYYKQIEGILSHGMPRGYFGYNQSRALYGSLGVWGMVPLIPYAAWGAVAGWDYLSPLYANIFFCVLALFVLCKMLKMTEKEMLMLSLFWIANQFLNRYVLSGVVEASVIMQLIFVTACGEYLLSEKIRGRQCREITPLKDCIVLAFCTFMVCVLTLARPYFAVLFLIPFWKCLRDGRKRCAIGLPVLAVFIMGLFFLNNHYFCATYFNNIFLFGKMQEAGILGFFVTLFEGFIEILRLIWYAIRYKGSGVGWYYLLLAIELAVMAFVCVRCVCRHKKMPRMYIVTLTGNFLIIASIIEIYDLGVGARHILSLVIANAVLLIVEAHFSLGAVLALICIVSIVQTQGADALPYKDSEYVEYMDFLEEEFNRVVSVSGEISYSNVVAMPTADVSVQDPEQSVCTYYGYLFAMPAGVGISLDFQDFYDVPENIKAGYILTHPSGKIRQVLEEAGMVCIFENDDMSLYSGKISP